MIYYIQDQGTWRTMTALQQSIKFYNDNNQTGKYNSALRKEKSMLQSYFDEVKLGSTEVSGVAA